MDSALLQCGRAVAIGTEPARTFGRESDSRFKPGPILSDRSKRTELPGLDSDRLQPQAARVKQLTARQFDKIDPDWTLHATGTQQVYAYNLWSERLPPTRPNE